MKSLNKYIEKVTDTTQFGDDKLSYLRNARLGFNLLLLNLSSGVAERLIHMREILDIVEERLFSPEMVRTFNDRELIGYFKLLKEANSEYIYFMERILKDTNWQDLEGLLLETEAIDKAKKELPGSDIKELIEKIAQKITTNQPKQIEADEKDVKEISE